MRLSVTGLFRARWTDRIHDEWIQAVLRNRDDLQPEQLDRTRQLMVAGYLSGPRVGDDLGGVAFAYQYDLRRS